jgi:hypothetical protein
MMVSQFCPPHIRATSWIKHSRVGRLTQIRFVVYRGTEPFQNSIIHKFFYILYILFTYFTHRHPILPTVNPRNTDIRTHNAVFYVTDYYTAKFHNPSQKRNKRKIFGFQSDVTKGSSLLGFPSCRVLKLPTFRSDSNLQCQTALDDFQEDLALKTGEPQHDVTRHTRGSSDMSSWCW